MAASRSRRRAPCPSGAPPPGRVSAVHQPPRRPAARPPGREEPYRPREGSCMAEPPVSVSECTTFPRSFAEDVAAYREGDADGIVIWRFKLEGGRDKENLAVWRDSGLRATVCVPEVPSIYPDGYFA